MAKRTQKIHLGGEALASRQGKFRNAQSCEWHCWWAVHRVRSGLCDRNSIQTHCPLCQGCAWGPAASALCFVASCKSMICLSEGNVASAGLTVPANESTSDDQILTCLCPEQIDAARTSTVHGLQLVINQQKLCSALQLFVEQQRHHVAKEVNPKGRLLVALPRVFPSFCP